MSIAAKLEEGITQVPKEKLPNAVILSIFMRYLLDVHRKLLCQFAEKAK